jgi:AmmeMemoRadiSam system protein B
MNRPRPPAVAGSFYPSDPDDLGGLIHECFNLSPLGPKGSRSPSTSLIAGMVPHAGYVYSGPCAAHFYAALDKSIQRVILLGVNHWAKGHRAALSPWDSWQTPSGAISVDAALNDFLEARVKFLTRNADAHVEEHSIEVQLPFLPRVLDDFTFLPISLARLDLDECAELGSAIAAACKGEFASGHNTIVLASSDLSHYLSPRATEELDRLALERVLALDAAGLLNVVEDKNITMCGVLPTAVMLYAAKALGATRARLLKHCHSGDVTPMRKVVGYASVAFEL